MASSLVVSGGPGLDAREATAALREHSVERLKEGFARVVQADVTSPGWDPRDSMISLMPFVDCAKRLGQDPAAVLGLIARTAPDWYRSTFEAFVRRGDLSLPAFGWSLAQTPQGPAYRFAWPPTSSGSSPRPESPS